MEVINFLEKQWKLIVGTLVGLGLVGALFVFVQTQAENKEKKAQESYFSVEKKLFDLKAKKESSVSPNKNGKDKTEASVDFSQIKKDLEKVITDFPGSTAAQMAAIHLAGLLTDEKNTEAALGILQKAENKDKGLVNTLVQQQIGQLLADQNKCQDAIAVWQKIINRKEASFIHNEIKIQQALCYTKLNDLNKAEEILTNLSNQSVNADVVGSSVSKEAEKYLRLIQFKKASGT